MKNKLLHLLKLQNWQQNDVLNPLKMRLNQNNPYFQSSFILLVIQYKKTFSRFNLKLFFLSIHFVVYNSVTLYIQFYFHFFFLAFVSIHFMICWRHNFYIIFLSWTRKKKKKIAKALYIQFSFFSLLLHNFLSSQWGSKWKRKKNCWEQIIWLHEFTLAWISIKKRNRMNKKSIKNKKR